MDDAKLATIAVDSGIDLGSSVLEVSENIKTIKAKEMAQALICLATDRLEKVEEVDRLPEHIEIEGCVSPSHEARGIELCADGGGGGGCNTYQ